jgi:hypothetical protein
LSIIRRGRGTARRTGRGTARDRRRSNDSNIISHISMIDTLIRENGSNLIELWCEP